MREIYYFTRDLGYRTSRGNFILDNMLSNTRINCPVDIYDDRIYGNKSVKLNIGGGTGASDDGMLAIFQTSFVVEFLDGKRLKRV